MILAGKFEKIAYNFALKRTPGAPNCRVWQRLGGKIRKEQGEKIALPSLVKFFILLQI